MPMKDKLAIVTGGAKGIGRATALAFAREGANVALIDLDAANLAKTAAEVKALGVRVLTGEVDVSDSGQVNEFVSRVAAELGPVDILVNCAALIIYTPFLDFEESDWRRMIDIGLTGYFLCAQAVARKMVEEGNGGRIINIASVAADFGVARGTAYCSMKAGVLGLTRVMALELAPHKINVNAVSPGPVETPQLRGLLTPEEIKERFRVVPAARFGQPGEIADAVVFLASDSANFISGENLRVDGGAAVTK